MTRFGGSVGWVAVAVGLLAAPAYARAEPLVVLFTGDSAGELRPCGCASGPAGGLARRATAVAQERAKGPRLLLDAGDALGDGMEQAETGHVAAALIFGAMGRMGYDAMAVGERDLALGVGALKGYAAEAKIRLLAANLQTASGWRPFQGESLFMLEGRLVGVFAVVEGPGYERQGLMVLPPEPEAARAAKKLRQEGAELVIGLLHMDASRAAGVTQTLEGVDYVVQSHDAAGSMWPRREGTTLMASGGDRARALERVAFDMRGKGPFYNLSETAEVKDLMADLKLTRQSALKERKPGDPGFEKELAAYAAREKWLQERMARKPRAGERTALTDRVPLDGRVADDPGVQAMLAQSGL